MRRLSKTFMMMIMLLCMFSYMGVVSAETTAKLSTVEKDSISAVSNLLTGKELSSADKAKITALKDKYTLYYQYQVIDADTYSKYKNGDSSAEDTITGLITDPSEVSGLTEQNGWKKVASEQISYTDLEYDAENPTGYVVVLMAVEGNNIYDYKQVYQATSATTLATYSSIAKGAEINDDVEKEDTIEKEDTGTEETDTEDEVEDTEEVEKSEKNPETGISDFAIYLVPLALVAGSALYLKRRNA